MVWLDGSHADEDHYGASAESSASEFEASNSSMVAARFSARQSSVWLGWDLHDNSTLEDFLSLHPCFPWSSETARILGALTSI